MTSFEENHSGKQFLFMIYRTTLLICNLFTAFVSFVFIFANDVIIKKVNTVFDVLDDSGEEIKMTNTFALVPHTHKRFPLRRGNLE